MDDVEDGGVHATAAEVVEGAEFEFAEGLAEFVRVHGVVHRDEFENAVLSDDAGYVGAGGFAVVGYEGDASGAGVEHLAECVIEDTFRGGGDGLNSFDVENAFDLCMALLVVGLGKELARVTLQVG